MIVFGVREAKYELHCSHGTVGRAMIELDDAGIARPTQIGAWRGRQATARPAIFLRRSGSRDLATSLRLPDLKKHPLVRSSSPTTSTQKSH